MKKNNSSKEDILNKIKTVRTGRSSFRFIPIDESKEIYKPVDADKIACFKSELEAISGKCIICEDEQSVYAEIKKFMEESGFPYIFCRDNTIIDKLIGHDIPYSSQLNDFENMSAGITFCEFLIARTGGVMVSSESVSGRQMNIFPPIHIVVAKAKQVIDYPQDAIIGISEKYKRNLPSAITTITGPSRTADIEKTLVLGAHGPKEIIVFISQN